MDTAKRQLKLQWVSVCTYNSAQSWVTTALNGEAAYVLKAVGPNAETRCEPLTKKRRNEEILAPPDAAPPEPPSRIPASSPGTAEPPSMTELTKQWLPLKALTSGDELAVVQYEQRAEIGRGTFGVVCQGLCKQTKEPVCLKTPRKPGLPEFRHELQVLARLTHPNIVELRDVVMRPAPCLVLQDAGENLHAVIERGPAPLAERQQMLQQLFAALMYLESQCVIHSDLKPRNICWRDGVLRVIDFGCSVVSVAGYRAAPTHREIETDGLQVATLWYRAPEILLGDLAFSFAADMWSAGLIWVEILLGRPVFRREGTQIGMILAQLRFCGSPGAEDLPYFSALPLWSSQWPAFTGGSLETTLAETTCGWQRPVLLTALRLQPSRRPSARSVLQALELQEQQPKGQDEVRPAASSQEPPSNEHPGANPAPVDEGRLVQEQPPLSSDLLQVVSSGGMTTWIGERGEFNLRQGVLSPEVLSWLRDDAFFRPSEDRKGWGWHQEAKGQRTEAGVKIERTGHLRDGGIKSGLQLNGQDASRPIFERARAWAQAFRSLNAQNFKEAQKEWRAALRKLKPEDRSVNGQRLLEEDVLSWACDLGAVQLMSPTNRHDPVHFDGGASFFHIGITIYGARELVMLPKGASPDEGTPLVKVSSIPGHVYCGSLCSARHFVKHWAEHPK